MSGLRSWISAIILLSISICWPAQAHNRSQSFSLWSIDQQQLNMLYTVKEREATRLQQGTNLSAEASLTSHLQQTIQVMQAGANCSATAPFKAMPAEPGYLRIAATFNCPDILDNNAPDIQIESFFNLVSSHIHYGRIAVQGQPPLEYLFTEARQQQHIAIGDTSWSTSLQQAFLQYTALGMEHIFTGVDHIAFLLALLLMMRHLRDVIWLVTGFTLGHSITLSLAVLGWVTPETAIVEALIGFTIALVAAENIGYRTGVNRQIAYVATGILVLMLLLSLSQLVASTLPVISFIGLILFTLSYLPGNKNVSSIQIRPALSLAFGLIHGFGFAAILQQVGLPSEQLWPALLGFNLGVELGQLLIVAVLWACYLRLKPYKNFTSATADLCSALLCGLGLYWFIARSYGPTIN
jgi:hypothetical protein